MAPTQRRWSLLQGVRLQGLRPVVEAAACPPPLFLRLLQGKGCKGLPPAFDCPPDCQTSHSALHSWELLSETVLSTRRFRHCSISSDSPAPSGSGSDATRSSHRPNNSVRPSRS